MWRVSLLLGSVVAVVLLLGGVTWAVHDVTKPGDPIQGVPNDGVSRNDDHGWPGNDAPNQAIDDQTTTNYLHFKGDREPTGVRVTPKGGLTVVTGIRLCTANDGEARDPASYELSGSNDSINGPYTLIAKGNLVDFTPGTVWPRRTWNATPIMFANTVAYRHYQLIFPTVRDPASADSMQIAEIELLAADLKAYAPNPADGAVITMPLFQWTKGATALFHNVYFGASPNLTDGDLRQKNSVLAMYYHMLPTDPGATYYWRVDEVEANGNIIKGDVWKVIMAPKKAYNPLPVDGNKWLPVNQQLSWTSGAGATKHDVYFSTDKAAVANRSASASKGSTSAPSFDPGALQQKTTYYWAVDETAGTSKYAGDIWSFTTLGAGGGIRGEYFVGTNPAGTPVLTRIDQTININTVDSPGPGVPADGWSARWTADLEITVSDTYTFSLNCQDGTRMWIDGQMIIDKWVVPTVTSEYFALPLYLERGIHALRVEFFDSGGVAVEQLNWSTSTMAKATVPAGPLQPPVRARAVYPANKAVDVSQDVKLMWSAGCKAKQHDIYFGTDLAAVANATRQTAGVYVGRQALGKGTYSPGTLEWNKTYYWRVDEVNEADAASPWSGAVWSFTTANAIIVDDFESYTDEAGEEIFSTWIDGHADNYKSSGSTVGNAREPFAEQIIVHGGRQSMPMRYDNSEKPFYSEAERSFTPALNCTVNGVDTLSLFFRGLTYNRPDTVYVALEDSAGKASVVSYANQWAVCLTKWVEWKIPLSQFAGVNLAKIRKVYVGVGDRKNPKTGWRTGRLYFDDIRVGIRGTGDVDERQAFNPYPANGEQGVSLSPTLTWSAGTGAVKHHVYFGSDEAAVDASVRSVYKGVLVTTSFKPGALTWGATYYWRVDEEQADGTVVEGPTWVFACVPPPGPVGTAEVTVDGYVRNILDGELISTDNGPKYHNVIFEPHVSSYPHVDDDICLYINPPRGDGYYLVRLKLLDEATERGYDVTIQADQYKTDYVRVDDPTASHPPFQFATMYSGSTPIRRNTRRDFVLWPASEPDPKPGFRPFYRFQSPDRPRFFFTANDLEMDNFLYDDYPEVDDDWRDPRDLNNWEYNGIVFWAHDLNAAGTLIPVYRFRSVKTGIPAYSTSETGTDLEGNPQDWQPGGKVFLVHANERPGEKNVVGIRRFWSQNLQCYAYGETRPTNGDWKGDNAPVWWAHSRPAQ